MWKSPLGLNRHLKNLFHLRIRLKNLSEIQNQELIIDGYAFLYSCYTDSNLDWLNGGEYTLFIDQIKKKLKNFENFKITFVFDGVRPDEKFATLKSRAEKQARINKMIYDTKESESIPQKDYITNERLFSLPMHSYAVLLDVLRDVGNIEIVVAPYEADPYIAALAIKRNCYVLSLDTDFMIYDIRGLILMSELEYKRDTGNMWGFIINRDILADALDIKSIYVSALPCILGCDYIDDVFVSEFHSSLLAKYKGQRHDNISRILRWFRDLKGNFAWEKVYKDKEKIETATKVQRLFNGDLTSFPISYDLLKVDPTFMDRNDFVRQFANGLISQEIVTLLMNKTIQLNMPGVLEKHDQTSHQLWGPIRARLYGRLFPSVCEISEFYNIKGEYLKHSVKSIDISQQKDLFIAIWGADRDIDAMTTVLLNLIALRRGDLQQWEIDALILSWFRHNPTTKNDIHQSARSKTFLTQFQVGVYLYRLTCQVFSKKQPSVYQISGTSFFDVYRNIGALVKQNKYDFETFSKDWPGSDQIKMIYKVLSQSRKITD